MSQVAETPRTPPDVVDIEERAYKAALTTSIPELVRYVTDQVGARIAAAALGLADARPLRGWANGQTQPKEQAVEDRLRTLYRVVRAITETYGGAAAAAFLRGSNPQLNDEAPLVLLAERPPAEGTRLVAGALRAFLGG